MQILNIFQKVLSTSWVLAGTGKINKFKSVNIILCSNSITNYMFTWMFNEFDEGQLRCLSVLGIASMQFLVTKALGYFIFLEREKTGKASWQHIMCVKQHHNIFSGFCEFGRCQQLCQYFKLYHCICRYLQLSWILYIWKNSWVCLYRPGESKLRTAPTLPVHHQLPIHYKSTSFLFIIMEWGPWSIGPLVHWSMGPMVH